MKKIKALKKSIVSLLIISVISTFTSFSCEKVKDLAERWQKYTVYKRYGVEIDKKGQIEDWEKEIKKYEKEIEKKITAGIKTAKIYRKIGEAYAGMEMYQPCVDYLQKAMDMGYVNDDILFMQALCNGAAARLHNWDEKYRNGAEAGFLKVLSNNPSFHRAKIELALLYFYGFGSRSGYSVNSEKISSSQKDYRNKAVKLANEYTGFMSNKPDGHIILAGMYGTMGERQQAIRELGRAVELFRKNYPNEYESRDDYRQTVINLNQLQNSEAK